MDIQNKNNQDESSDTLRDDLAPQAQTNRLALASMITGIVGIVSCCIPPLQLALGIAGIVLVVLSKKGQPFSGYAIAGLVLSILSILCSVVMFGYSLLYIYLVKNPDILNDLLKQYQTMGLLH